LIGTAECVSTTSGVLGVVADGVGLVGVVADGDGTAAVGVIEGDTDGDGGAAVGVIEGDTDGADVALMDAVAVGDAGDGAGVLALGDGVAGVLAAGVSDVPPVASFAMMTTATTTTTAMTAATTRRRGGPVGPAVDVDGSAVMSTPRVTTGSYRRHRE